MTCLSCEERRRKIAAVLRTMLHLPHAARKTAIEQAERDPKLRSALAASWMAANPGWARKQPD